MQYVITELDKRLVSQKIIDVRIKIKILSNDMKTLDVITGISNVGNFCINANSNIRRTASFTILLDENFRGIENRIESYMAYKFSIEFGIKNIRTDDYVYYQMGVFRVTQSSTSYDAENNTLSINLSDLFCTLDNTRNGQIGGSPTILIPVEYQGTKMTIRGAVASVITAETDIKDYIIQDVGEYYGIPENNENYLEYRSLNPEWNILPFDLEFRPGISVGDILCEIRDLYPNCQLYFDIYGCLCFDMVPSNNKSPVLLSDEYIQSILLANATENVEYQISNIKNVIEVFGKSYDIDRMSDSCSFENDVYNIYLPSYDSYSAYDIIAFTPPKENSSITKININGINSIPLYKEYTESYIDSNTLSSNITAVIQIRKNTDGALVAYYLGQYQPHALAVLTDSINDTLYTKQYFSERYNCQEKNICFVEVKDSAFSIQKEGIVLDSKIGDEYDNILSDSVAMENAKYLLYKSSVWNDVVTITTNLMPWIDVHTKVEYRKQQEIDPHIYIVKEVTHNFESGTTALTMYRFYSLYQE